MGAWERYQVYIDESRMIYSKKDFQRIISVTSEYIQHIPKFNSLKNGNTVGLKNASPLAYSTTGGRDHRTVIIAWDNYRAQYHKQTYS